VELAADAQLDEILSAALILAGRPAAKNALGAFALCKQRAGSWKPIRYENNIVSNAAV
jgi:hypothetical protein